MGGIHHRGSVLLAQVVGETIGTAEAANPDPSWRQAWSLDPSGKRGNHLDAVCYQRCRELSRLGGTAQEQNRHGRNPRIRTATANALIETAAARRLARAISAISTGRPLPKMPRSSIAP